MQTKVARGTSATSAYQGARLALLGVLALLMLLPVTLPVAVLRALVHERFGVSELLTSLFMSINMVGAVLAAPVAGALADRFGRRRDWIVAALLADAACLYALSLPVSAVVIGMPKREFIAENIATARGFTPMNDQEMERVRKAVAPQQAAIASFFSNHVDA